MELSKKGQRCRIKRELARFDTTSCNFQSFPGPGHIETNVEANAFDKFTSISNPHPINTLAPTQQQLDSNFEIDDDFQNLMNEPPLSDEEHKVADIINNNDNLIQSLRNWAITYRISLIAITALLSILKNHPCFKLPGDARTLLKTPINIMTRIVDPGSYSHIGSKLNLQRILETVSESVTEVLLLFNIDGLPLFSSSSNEFWPILGSIFNIPSLKSLVFPIGIYFGKTKPYSCSVYLQEFVAEVTSLIKSGLDVSGKIMKVGIKGFICDAPAKSFLLGIKGHTGYYSCTKCKQSGVFLQNRVTFPECDAAPRTHEEFVKMLDEDFHIANSPLIDIPGIDFIKNFPLDYMHLVCLGVMRTLIYLWKFGPPSVKLSSKLIDDLSVDLIDLGQHMPLEFNRKPRSLNDIRRWKATECRQFLLYLGPVVLYKLRLNYAEYYRNFLSLSVSINILLSPENCLKFNDYAKDLLKYFVKSFSCLYGSHLVTHNLHGLTHISDDVYEFGPLDSCSAFPFENFLQVFKQNIRKGDKPLQQIIKRFGERLNTNFWSKNVYDASPSTYPRFCNPHFSRSKLLTDSDQSKQFQTVEFDSFKLTITHPNCYCCLNDGSIIEIKNIVFCRSLKCMVLICQEFSEIKNFFEPPLLESSNIGIYVIKKNFNLIKKKVADVVGKVILFPYQNDYVAMKMLHSFSK
uniref:Putative enspm-4 hm n=1 Tax=Xenopsylla cheopis TaxID=163159 RepID=A0A6M2DPH5_XENCH